LWDNFSLTTAVSYSTVTAIAAVVGMFMFIKSYSHYHPTRTILS
jgi:hypothetical protein